MAFEKITVEDMQGKGVAGLPDTPSLSATEMQNKFEEISKQVIVPKFNALADKLNEKNIENAVSSMDITNIRLSADNTIQISKDGGYNFGETASSGHILADFEDETYPQRSRMRFSDNVRVRDNAASNTTEIIIANGEKGDPAVVNGKQGAEITLDGDDIKLTGYIEIAEGTPLDPQDSVNEAFAKLAKYVEVLETFRINSTTMLTATIPAGEKSVTIENARITEDSIIDVYFKDRVVVPTGVVVNDGSVTINVSGFSVDVEVGVRCV